MSCEAFAPDFADFPSLNYNFKILNKNQLIEKLQKQLQVFPIANTVIKMQSDSIMKHMAKILETDISLIEEAPVQVATKTTISTSTVT